MGASQKFDQLLIPKACRGDSTIPVRFEYWKPEGTRHIVRQGIAGIHISDNEWLDPGNKMKKLHTFLKSLKSKKFHVLGTIQFILNRSYSISRNSETRVGAAGFVVSDMIISF